MAPVSNDELLRLARKVWGANLSLSYPVTHGAVISIHEQPLVRVEYAGALAPQAVHAALLVLAGEEHPDVRKLREALAAADVALTTAQNDLDAAGREIERQRSRAHAANNKAQAYLSIAESEAQTLSKAGLSDAAQRYESDIAAVGKASVPPAAEDVADPRRFVP